MNVLLFLQANGDNNAINIQVPRPSLHDWIYLVVGFVLGVIVMTIIYEREMKQQRERYRRRIEAVTKEKEEDQYRAPARRVKRFLGGD